MMPLECPLCCDGTFNSHAALKQHIQIVLENLRCPSCKIACKLDELPKHLVEECVNNEEIVRVPSRKRLRQKSQTEFEGEDVFVDEEEEELFEAPLQVKIEAGNEDLVTAKNSEKQSEVANHTTQDTPEMMYSCEMCDMTFYNIQEHLDQYHQDEEVLVEGLEEEEETGQIDDDNFFDEVGIIEENSQEEDTDSQCEERMDVSNKSPLIEKYYLEKGRLWKLSQIESTKVLSKKQIVEIYSCQNCKLQFPHLTHFEKHQCQEIPKKPEPSAETKQGRVQYQCAFCCSIYLTLPELQKHMKKHLNGNDLGPTEPKKITMSLHICPVCNTKFPTFKQLKLHSKIHEEIEIKESPPFEDPETQFQCEVCKRTYEKQYKEIHMKSHEDEGQFICTICNKTLDSKENLEHHSKVHTSEKKFTCSYCKKSFINFLSLEKHLNSECQPREFACSYCGRRFSRPNEKVKHERIHTGEKPHVCDICGKAFRVKYCLTLHMRTHTGDRPYTCHLCGKQFKSHSVCSHHLKTHLEDRNYKCPFCPKTFKTAVQLAGHKNCHTKPFSCTECCRPFSSLYAIRAHMQSHKKDNSLKFNCSICGAEYGRSYALKDHLKEFHGYDADEEAKKQRAEKESENVDKSADEDEAMAQESSDVVQIFDDDGEGYVVHLTEDPNGTIEDGQMETVETI